MGVERFFLYDNGSRDDHERVLAPYVAEGMVIVHQWPHAFLGHNGRPRAIFTAFEDCCGRHAQDARWIAFLDVDEFLFSPTGASLPMCCRNTRSSPAWSSAGRISAPPAIRQSRRGW